MNKKIETGIKATAIVGILILLFSSLATATVREDVRNMAMHAFDKNSVNGNRVNTNNYGNWNWISSVPDTYSKMKEGYKAYDKNGKLSNCFASLWSTATDGSGCFSLVELVKPVSFYNDVGAYGFYDSKGRGMQCKAFANGVVYATGQTGKNLITGQPQIIFPGTGSLIQYFDDPAKIANPVPSEARYSKPGNVIFIKTLTGYDKNKNPIYSYTNYYTVISVNSGDSGAGTVTSIQAKNNLGNEVTINGDNLKKYRISKYARGYQFAQPADVIFKSSAVPKAGGDHFAMVVSTTGNYGSVVSADVVDSNYVGGAGNEEIGRHTMQNAELAKYYVYTGVSYYKELWSSTNPTPTPTLTPTPTVTPQPPQIASISPAQTLAGTFDLTVNGNNFDSGAIDQIYWKADMRLIGQGAVKSRTSTKVIVTESMTGATPGVYVVKVKNSDGQLSNGKDLTITAPPNPTLSVSPALGLQGTTFKYSGTKYTPAGIVEWHVQKPDGTEYPPADLTGKVDGSGNFNYNYVSHCGSMVGIYTIWGIDKSTGKRSNDITETIKASASCINVQYQAHFANTGWMTDWVQDGQTAGTPGGNQMEAIRIKTTNYDLTYRAHVANDGWLSWVSNGADAGTTGQGKSLQAIEIKLQNAPSNLHVYYRVYVHDKGWQPWVSDGAMAGTTGLGLAVEAIEIKIQN